MRVEEMSKCPYRLGVGPARHFKCRMADCPLTKPLRNADVRRPVWSLSSAGIVRWRGRMQNRHGLP